MKELQLRDKIKLSHNVQSSVICKKKKKPTGTRNSSSCMIFLLVINPSTPMLHNTIGLTNPHTHLLHTMLGIHSIETTQTTDLSTYMCCDAEVYEMLKALKSRDIKLSAHICDPSLENHSFLYMQ